MRAMARLLFILLGTASPAQAQGDRLAAVAWLAGDWTGNGEGRPGSSTSTRHNVRAQGGHFIRVEARSIYPQQPSNPTGETHSSTDFWSFDRARGVLVLRQFDSLGFVSTYVQDVGASTNGRIVMVSEHLENVPVGWRARYTYEHPTPDEYRELFELDGGRGLEPYVSNRFVRAGAASR